MLLLDDRLSLGRVRQGTIFTRGIFDLSLEESKQAKEDGLGLLLIACYY